MIISGKQTDKFNLTSIKKLAFTLAEVLIVVGIIGIIAEITIPTLVKQFQEKVLVSQFKKTYSNLNQAYTMAIMNEGEPRTWNVTCSNDIVNILAKYFQTNKVDAPPNSNVSAGIAAMGYQSVLYDLRKSRNDGGVNYRPQIQLKSGEVIRIMEPSEAAIASGMTCSPTVLHDICFFVVADINGQKLPNRYGVDIFGFQATPLNIIPFGSVNAFSLTATLCDTSANPTWGELYNGSSCGSWVLTHENMDYLKCVDEGDTAYCHSYVNN